MTINLSPVMSVGEYKARAGRLTTDTVDDTVIGELLTSVTRVVEKRLGYAPGMLVPQTALTFVFDGSGESILRLRDERGFMYPLRSITADSLKIDSDFDGSFDDYLFDAADAWVQLAPVNASQYGEPYTWIELRAVTTAPITVFPSGRANIQIVGNWGYAETPGVVRERVYGMTREVLDAERNGGASVSQYDMEEVINRVPSARALLAVLEREYSQRIPVFG